MSEAKYPYTKKELKLCPCPKCGGRAEAQQFKNRDALTLWEVHCVECDAKLQANSYTTTLLEVTQYWNNSAAEAYNIDNAYIIDETDEESLAPQIWPRTPENY